MLFPTYDFFFLNVNHLFFLVIFSMIHLSHLSLTLFLTHSSVDCLKEIIFINMWFVFFLFCLFVFKHTVWFILFIGFFVYMSHFFSLSKLNFKTIHSFLFFLTYNSFIFARSGHVWFFIALSFFIRKPILTLLSLIKSFAQLKHELLSLNFLAIKAWRENPTCIWASFLKLLVLTHIWKESRFCDHASNGVSGANGALADIEQSLGHTEP